MYSLAKKSLTWWQVEPTIPMPASWVELIVSIGWCYQAMRDSDVLAKKVYIINKLIWGGDPDAPDPKSGLSNRDIHNVQHTWAPVYAKAETYGLELFLRLFRTDPDTKNYFITIRGLKETQLKESPQFKAHAINLMSSLNMAILNLKSPLVVAAMMHKLGESHRKHNIQQKYFYVFKGVLIDFLVNDLKLNDAKMGSWSRFMDFIYPQIFAKLYGTSTAT